MDDLLQLIRLCSLRDTEHSMSMKGYTSEQNMTTVEDGYNTADEGGPLQIRESSGYEEQHSRSFARNILTDCVHEHSRRNADSF